MTMTILSHVAIIDQWFYNHCCTPLCTCSCKMGNRLNLAVDSLWSQTQTHPYKDTYRKWYAAFRTKEVGLCICLSVCVFSYAWKPHECTFQDVLGGPCSQLPVNKLLCMPLHRTLVHLGRLKIALHMDVWISTLVWIRPKDREWYLPSFQNKRSGTMLHPFIQNKDTHRNLHTACRTN